MWPTEVPRFVSTSASIMIPGYTMIVNKDEYGHCERDSSMKLRLHVARPRPSVSVPAKSSRASL